jgi:nicotinate-nucleotide pyrophosphorylase (carboxylating)
VFQVQGATLAVSGFWLTAAGLNMAKEFQQIEWDAAIEADCRRIVRAAVLEDLDRGYDWTTLALAPANAVGRATVVARRGGVVAGLPAAAVVIDEMDKSLCLEPRISDGAAVASGEGIASLHGPVRSMLAAERLILNLLGRLSGIATLTRRYVDAIAGTKARIYDTRKTTPGWRRLEKYAVRQGGGHNHRLGLFDAILIKDNHLAFTEQFAACDSSATGLRETDASSAGHAVRRARKFLAEAFPNDARSQMIVEVEVDSLAQLRSALTQRPDIVLLDNMTVEQLHEAVTWRDAIAPAVELEASGGVDLSSVRLIAESGVDRISVGAMTHSAASLNVALDWQYDRSPG